MNYPIYDKELLAVMEAFKQWRVYLEGPAVLVFYFVDWVGYNQSEQSWEPAANLAHATVAV